VFATRESTFASASSVASLRLQSTFVGWDFQNTWGFGNCSYNDGLPLLRFAAEVSQYESTACFHVLSFDSAGGSSVEGTTFTTSGTVVSAPIQPVRSGFEFSGWSQTPSGTAVSFPFTPAGQSDITLYAIWTSNEVSNPESPAPAPVYSGPIIRSGILEGVAGGQITVQGTKLDSVTNVSLNSIELEIKSIEPLSLIAAVPDLVAPGTYDLIFETSYGSLTVLNAVNIAAASPALKLSQAATDLVGKSRVIPGSSPGQSQLSPEQKAWFAQKLDGSGLTRVVCTSIISESMTVHEKIQLRIAAKTACEEAASLLDNGSVWVQSKLTSTPSYIRKVMVTFKG
jgi:uncharacterized repeat protein (TIGR02543 family)